MLQSSYSFQNSIIKPQKKIPSWCFELAAANVGLEKLKKEFACYIYIYA